MGLLQAAAKGNSTAVVLDFSERSPTNSVYISQVIISPQGEVLKPTRMELTTFSDGLVAT